MIGSANIGTLDKLINIWTAVNDDSGGQRTISYPAITYADVRARELRASGNESYEGNQQVHRAKKAWKIRKFDRSISVQDKVTFENDSFWITEIHAYQGDRRHLVLECEALDND